jgi:hypothetical protein
MSASGIMLSPRVSHPFAAPENASKLPSNSHTSTPVDVFKITNHTPPFTLHSATFAQHGITVEPSSSMAVFQKPELIAKSFSFYQLPSTISGWLTRYKEMPMAPEHEQKGIQMADLALQLLKTKIQNSTEEGKGKVIRQIASFDLNKAENEPANFFQNPFLNNKKPTASGAYTDAELGAAIRNVMKLPSSLAKMFASGMSYLPNFMAQSDPKSYQQLLSLSEKSRLWLVKDAKNSHIGAISQGPLAELIKAYSPKTIEQNAKYLEGHATGSVLLQPSLSSKPELGKALVDNLVDQAHKSGQKHLWVYLPKNEDSMIRQVQTKHAGTAVSVEEAQKALHFVKPEIVQSALSAYNLVNLKLFHIKL